MTYLRRAKRTDLNQAEIVQALRSAGARVWILGQPLDLLVGFRGRLVLLEVKSHKRTRADQAHQTELIYECQTEGLPVFRVESPADALRAIGATA